jgi:hypothetical protein
VVRTLASTLAAAFAFMAVSAGPAEVRAEPRKIVVVAQGGLERQPLALAAAAAGREPYLLKTPDGACLDDRAASALLARSAASEMIIGCAVVTAGTTMVMVRRVHPGGVERRAGVVDGAGTPQELARITNALAAQAMGARPPAAPSPAPTPTPPPPPVPAAPPPAPACPLPAVPSPPLPALPPIAELPPPPAVPPAGLPAVPAALAPAPPTGAPPGDPAKPPVVVPPAPPLPPLWHRPAAQGPPLSLD